MGDIKEFCNEHIKMYRPRLIPILLLRSKGLVKTINFKKHRYIGDPINAVKIFNETANLPKLQLAPPSTAHVDAISVRGKRYAIKSTSGSGTGIFASINIDDTDSKFEFLLVLRWDSYRVKSLLQFTWNQFVEFRKIKNPEGKYNFPLNNSVVRNAEVIYEK